MRRAAALLALLGLAARAAPPDWRAGQQALDRGNPAAAERLWLQGAAAGDLQAQFSLGLLYDLGADRPSDPARAFRCYLIAAGGGLPSAEFNVAVMLDAGRGIRRDGAGAALWYARAAANGHTRAEYNLAQLYAAGDGVPRNPIEAAAWLREAAASGIAAARRPPSPVPATLVAAGQLLPAALAPAAMVPLPGGFGARAELVWLAPAQPIPARTYVAVYRNDPDGPHLVFAATTDLSAVAVDLPPAQFPYVWRVYTLAQGTPHYAASAWAGLPAATDAAR